ncbi:hypothetical protein [Nitrosococcus oceani]|uniref:hypothetical protein n=1 Tax=Nitrosococcus oceani TaxID=1229 RepID=UPI001FD2C7DD|nr:hypothetical protein [Nitrosococcus oceani]
MFTKKRYKVRKSAVILAIFSLAMPAISNSAEDVPSNSYPHIPEPMVFDLVRPLGALKGELEANTLLQYDFAHDRTEANPEVEYTFADGYGIEFELPIDNTSEEGTSIAAYKISLQGTFNYPQSSQFIHGWQYSGEYFPDQNQYQNNALYLFGYRFNKRWSTLNMVGLRRTDLSSKGHFEGLFNSNLFYTLSPRLTMGLEINWKYKSNRPDQVLIIPQAHLKFTKHTALQFGAGMQRVLNRNFAHLAARLIFTF